LAGSEPCAAAGHPTLEPHRQYRRRQRPQHRGLVSPARNGRSSRRTRPTWPSAPRSMFWSAPRERGGVGTVLKKA